MKYSQITHYKELELNSLTDDEVLFFVRIHGKKGIFGSYYPMSFLDSFTSLKDYRTISEYSKGDFHIDLNSVKLTDISFEDYWRYDAVLDVNEIIERCRALREIPFNESIELIYKSCKAVENIVYQNPNLKLIVSLAVDNYVMDVMSRICSLHDVKLMRMIGFFISGYYRFIQNGIGVSVRDVEESEVDEVFNNLANKTKSYLAVSKTRSIKNAFRDYFSYRYRFMFRYLYKHKLVGRLEYEYKFMPYFRGFHKLSKLNCNQFFDTIKVLNEKNDDDMIFVPLHYHPEATVDYWVEDRRLADYLNSLIKLVAFFKEKNITVVFKEHPNYYLRRSIEFYKKLKLFSNVIILNPFISTQVVFDMISTICVYTGSAGLEGMMLNKKVYTLTENYYTFNSIPLYTEFSADYNFLSTSQKKGILLKVLSSTIKI